MKTIGTESSRLLTPIWQDPTNPQLAVGGVMQHPSGAVTFSTGNMLFLRMMMDPGTSIEARTGI